MLQNWLKPIKGHNGPVPALNVIPEPGRNRVNDVGTVDTYIIKKVQEIEKTKESPKVALFLRHY